MAPFGLLNCGWNWLKILFWLNSCERKTLFRLKKSPYPVRRHHSRFLLVLCLETHHYLYWHVGTMNLVKGAIMQDRGPKRRIGQHIDNSRRILMCAPMCTVHATSRLINYFSSIFQGTNSVFLLQQINISISISQILVKWTGPKDEARPTI